MKTNGLRWLAFDRFGDMRVGNKHPCKVTQGQPDRKESSPHAPVDSGALVTVHEPRQATGGGGLLAKHHPPSLLVLYSVMSSGPLISPDMVQLALVSVRAEVGGVGGSGGARDGQGRNG